MSDETLAALVGAAIGAAVTILLTLSGRWWIFRDSRAASRRAYVAIAAARLQRLVTALSKTELDDLNDETFEISAMAVHLPRWDTAVHIWFVFQQRRLFSDAVLKVAAGKTSQNQIDLFGETIDVIQELTAWARGQWSRSGAWFWIQLRTTERYEWLHASKLGKAGDKRIKAARHLKAEEGRARLRKET